MFHAIHVDPTCAYIQPAPVGYFAFLAQDKTIFERIKSSVPPSKAHDLGQSHLQNSVRESLESNFNHTTVV